MSRAVIYARVSSTEDRQSTERQVADLKRYAAASGMEVIEVFEEKASGTKKDREQLAACLEFLRGGGAEHLLLTYSRRLKPGDSWMLAHHAVQGTVLLVLSKSATPRR